MKNIQVGNGTFSQARLLLTTFQMKIWAAYMSHGFLSGVWKLMKIPASCWPTIARWSENNRNALPHTSGIHCIAPKSTFLGLCLPVVSWLVFPSHHPQMIKTGTSDFISNKFQNKEFKFYQELQFGENKFHFQEVSTWEVQIPSQQSIKMPKQNLCWEPIWAYVVKHNSGNPKACGGPSDEILQPRLRYHMPSG